jgi:predicted DNA-binding protein YlxM (UPF0122 family)
VAGYVAGKKKEIFTKKTGVLPLEHIPGEAQVDCGTSKKAVLDKINLNKNLLSGYEKDLKSLLKKIPVFEDVLSAYI